MGYNLIIDAAYIDETRIVTTRDGIVENFIYENNEDKDLKNNIYLGIIVKIEHALQAAFVEYSPKKIGFIAFKNIHPSFFINNKDDKKRTLCNGQQIKCGQKILVQIIRGEQETKRAMLTSFISISSRYIIFMPNKPNSSGVSKKIKSKIERLRIKIIMEEICNLVENKESSLIIRTSTKGQAKQKIENDYNYLAMVWKEIKETAANAKAGSLIYKERDIINRTIRDLHIEELDEIIIQGHKIYNTINNLCQKILPEISQKIKLYKKNIPIFTYYKIEDQLIEFCSNKIPLPSGGYIVISPTEALISIDVNSGKMTSEKNLQETAFRTNAEAAKEVARQLQARELSGLIVIDFIDMDSEEMRTKIEKILSNELKNDRAKININKINNFGLLELSRQKTKSHNIIKHLMTKCPHCNGTGTIHNIFAITISLIRSLEAVVIKNKKSENTITVYTSNEIAIYLLNKYRSALHRLEFEHNTEIMVKTGELITEKFKIKINQHNNNIQKKESNLAITNNQ